MASAGGHPALVLQAPDGPQTYWVFGATRAIPACSAQIIRVIRSHHVFSSFPTAAQTMSAAKTVPMAVDYVNMEGCVIKLSDESGIAVV